MENRGTPRFHVDIDVIDAYRQSRLKWTQIAQILNVSTKTLINWRNSNDYEVNR